MPSNSTSEIKTTGSSPFRGGAAGGGVKGGGLLEHFKELTVHPKNAEELKGLILQLAIQGKLTKKWREENPDIESASVLLKKIAAEKVQLIKDKKIKKEKTLAVITEKEITYELPDGWKWCRLGETGYTQTGSTPPKKNPDYYGDFIPFIGPADISNQWMKYPNDGLSKQGITVGRLIPEGSIMMVCIGGSIGKCNINEIDVSCNQQINIITPLNIPSVYIKTVCQSPYFQNEVWEKSSGSATPIINKGKWESIAVPVPPHEEQKAIVSTVNQLFAAIEELELQTKARIQLKEDFVTSALQQLAKGDTATEWAFLQEHFRTFFTEKTAVKKLRESILQLAVQGKLTTHWRASHPLGGDAEGRGGIESAATLLEKIKAEKAQLIKDKKIKKEKPLPEITEEEIPYALPEGWEWCKLGDVIKDKPKNGYSPRGVDFETRTKSLKLGATTKGVFDSTQVKYLEEIIPDESHLWLKKNDILIQRSNSLDYVGVSAIYKGDDFEFVYPDLMMKIKACTSVDTFYLHTVLSSSLVRSYFRRNASGTSGNMPKINQGIVLNTLMPIPPEEEQKAIVAKVNALMALCDTLEKEIEQNTHHLEQLMQSCLREVFEN